MLFNTMLTQRIFTALVGIPLIVCSIWFGYLPFLVFVLALVILSSWEFNRLLTLIGLKPFLTLNIILSILVVLSIVFTGGKLAVAASNDATGAILCLILIVLFFSNFFRKNIAQAVLDIAGGFLGVIYAAWMLAHLILLRDIAPLGREYTFLLFFVIWGVDIGAYFVGKRYGRHSLFATISPKKTLEGAVGGLILGVGISFLVSFLLIKNLSWAHSLGLGLIIGIFGQMGDYAESLIKRNAEIKDSSDLLPGHGGILDRFDSLIFTAPLVYYYIKFFVL
ncbi:MAG: phosphatidate cytidylyltransferase [Elusimicrobiota bacterium]